jgi:hypothetical protein
MKTIQLLIFSCLILIGGCKSDNEEIINPIDDEDKDSFVVEQIQRSILWNWASTRIGESGKYSSPAFYSLLDEYSNNELIGIEMHTSFGSALTPTFNDPGNNNVPTFTKDMNDRLEAIIYYKDSFPIIRLNDEHQGGVILDTDNIRNSISEFNAQELTLGIAAKATVENNVITVNTKTKFFKESEGRFHLSVLLVEDEVNSVQQVGAEKDSNYLHKKVLRASAINGTGSNQKAYTTESIVTGNITANTELQDSFKFEYTPTTNLPDGVVPWEFKKSNTSVVVIVWKQIGFTFNFDMMNVVEVAFTE